MRVSKYQNWAISRAVSSVLEKLETRRLLSTVYVDATAPGGNNGADWGDAYTSLQQALTTAVPGETIEVGQGTYFPSNTGDPTASFKMPGGVALEGGYAGYGTPDPDAQAPSLYPTILSGNVGSTASYQVLSFTGFNRPDATLVGFTITGGDGTPDDSDGGGIYVNDCVLTISDCIITGNTAVNGGGLANENGGIITLTDCTFTADTATNNGGALYESVSTSTLTDCTFNGDEAGNNGGAINEYYSYTTLTNCVISGDGAANQGGAIYNQYSSVTILDSTLAGDTAGMYSALGNAGSNFSYSSTTTLENSIVWDNGPDNANEINPTDTTATYSDIDQSFGSPYPGTGNIFGNPFFVRNPGTNGSNDSGNLELQFDSFAKDVGNNALVSLTVTTDLAGNPRFYNGTVDMGAYEYFPGGALPDLEAANVNADPGSVNFGGSVEVSWTDLNAGNATAAGNYTDSIFLSTTPQLTDSSVPMIQISPSQPIAADNDASFGISISIPAETRTFEQGTYYLIVRTNSTWADSESNESNNDGFTAIEITHPPQTYYVDADTPASANNQNGLSWATAFSTIPPAQNLAFPGDTILVAQGTYFPTNTNNQSLSFQLTEGVTLLGGYGGNEVKVAGGNPGTRNVAAYSTVLSGLIAGASNPSMSSYNVVIATDVDSTTDLDGFTITGAYGYDSAFGGGGIYLQQASPTINDCTFTANFATEGGGMECNDFSSPTVTNCTFTDNAASEGGGMTCNEDSSPTITNCTFTGNSGSALFNNVGCSPTLTDCTFTSNTGGLGGAVSDYQSSPTLINCIITNNSASDGGAFYNDGSSPYLLDCIITGDNATGNGGGFNDYASSPILINCLIAGDGANEGGGIYSYQSVGHSGIPTEITNCTIANDTGRASAYGAIATNTSPMTVTNSIIYGDGNDELGVTDITATYSDIQGSLAGKGNINVNPEFVNATNNFQLQAGSPCINVGDNNAPGLSGITTDVAGNPRIVGGTVDMGAYEFQSATIASVTWTGDGDGINWSSAGNWSDDAVPNQNDDVIVPAGFAHVDVNAGTYVVHSLTASSTITIAGGSLTLDNASVIGPSLVFQGGGTLDLLNNELTINYGTSADPIAAIQSELGGGYNGGKWNGSGIVSSAVASENTSQSALIYSVGYADGADGITTTPSGKIEILPTLAGDAKMQGNVVFGDFQLLSQYFGKAGSWDEGNFTYGSAVNFGDFQLLSQNFGATASLNKDTGTPGLASANKAAASPNTAQTSAASTTQAPDDTIVGSILGIGGLSPFSDLPLI